MDRLDVGMNQAARLLNLAAEILDIHSIHGRKQAQNGVGIDLPEIELNVLQHDVGRTCRDQIDVLTVVLADLDPAPRVLSSDLVTIDDESPP